MAFLGLNDDGTPMAESTDPEDETRLPSPDLPPPPPAVRAILRARAGVDHAPPMFPLPNSAPSRSPRRPSQPSPPSPPPSPSEARSRATLENDSEAEDETAAQADLGADLKIDLGANIEADMASRLNAELGVLLTDEARLHAEVVRLKAGGMLECRASVAEVCRTVGMEDLEKEEAGGEIAWRKKKLQEKKAAKKEEELQRKKLKAAQKAARKKSKGKGTLSEEGTLSNLANFDISAIDISGLADGALEKINSLDDALEDALGDALDVALVISDGLEGAALEVGGAVMEGVDQVSRLTGGNNTRAVAINDPATLAWPRFVPVRRPSHRLPPRTPRSLAPRYTPWYFLR